jgi:hypothetical protein
MAIVATMSSCEHQLTVDCDWFTRAPEHIVGNGLAESVRNAVSETTQGGPSLGVH